MGCVRIVWGSGVGPTELTAYDAALAAANVHDYNLLRVSSVLPADATIELAGVAPDLGPVGGKLTVVEARETIHLDRIRKGDTGGDGIGSADPANVAHDIDTPTDGIDRPTVCAGLGWAQVEDGRGIVYEAGGSTPGAVRRRIDEGLRAGCALRGFTPARSDRVVLTADGTATRIEHGKGTLDGVPKRARDPDGGANEEYLTAVVLAAYGESEPIL